VADSTIFSGVGILLFEGVLDTGEPDHSSGEKVSLTHASKDEKSDNNPIIDFKAKLRKSTSKQEQTSTTNDDIDDAPPLNFQARLRKTSGTSKAPNASNDNNTSLSDVKKNQNGAEKRDSVDSIGCV
jgi:hypothetical protein